MRYLSLDDCRADRNEVLHYWFLQAIAKEVDAMEKRELQEDGEWERVGLIPKKKRPPPPCLPKPETRRPSPPCFLETMRPPPPFLPKPETMRPPPPCLPKPEARRPSPPCFLETRRPPPPFLPKPETMRPPPPCLPKPETRRPSPPCFLDTRRPPPPFFPRPETRRPPPPCLLKPEPPCLPKPKTRRPPPPCLESNLTVLENVKDDGGWEEVKPKTKRIKKQKPDCPNPPPDMPENLRRHIVETMGGSGLVLVIQKPLFFSDVNPSASRFSIPFSQIATHDFLNETEVKALDDKKKKNPMQVSLLDPSMVQTTHTFNKWVMNNNSLYVMTKPWNEVVKRNGLKEDDIVQLWSFRVDSKLFFALVKLEVQPVT